MYLRYHNIICMECYTEYNTADCRDGGTHPTPTLAVTHLYSSLARKAGQAAQTAGFAACILLWKESGQLGRVTSHHCSHNTAFLLVQLLISKTRAELRTVPVSFKLFCEQGNFVRFLKQGRHQRHHERNCSSSGRTVRQPDWSQGKA